MSLRRSSPSAYSFGYYSLSNYLARWLYCQRAFFIIPVNLLQMTYAEKLKDPRWQKKRLQILNRDEFKCVLCGDDTSSLHIHHTYYKNGVDVWDYPDESLLTYCEHCHFVVEYLKKENSSLVAIKFKKYRLSGNTATILCIVKNIDIDLHELVVVSIDSLKVTNGLYFESRLVSEISSLLTQYNNP